MGKTAMMVKKSNHFNNLFTTIAAKLVEKLPSGTCVYRAASNIVKTFYTSRRNSDMKFNLKQKNLYTRNYVVLILVKALA